MDKIREQIEHKRFRNSWTGMHYRCNNARAKQYKHYGARGIKVCKEWGDFECFKKWASTSGYKAGLSIDRRDNDGPYSPDNCRWATQKQQVWNSRRTTKITYNGETKSISGWAKHIGISRASFRRRLRTWSLDDVINRPPSANAAEWRSE